MDSLKPDVIRALFDSRWDDAAGALVGPSLVTLDDVADELNVLKPPTGKRKPLSKKNVANFFKDIIRKRTANANWPPYIFAHGYTGAQVTGDGACFEFVRTPAGAVEPFPRFRAA